MTFQIFNIIPVYCDRDAISGHRAVRQPNTYQTEACAFGIARRLMQENEESEYVVVPAGGSPFGDALYPQRADNFDDIPF